MNFADLYRYSNELDVVVTPLQLLKERVIAFHPNVGDVEFWACKLDQNISRGHMVYHLDRTSPYEEEYDVASIRYDQELNRCWRRFVCCKELMHVFDSSAQRVDSVDRVKILLDELQTNPLSEDESPMFTSERDAEWMALLALCPERIRNRYIDGYVSSPERDKEIATELKIPQVYIRALMGVHYLRALEILTGEPSAPGE